MAMYEPNLTLIRLSDTDLTLADLDDSDQVRRLHIAEALAWRHSGLANAQPRALAAVG